MLREIAQVVFEWFEKLAKKVCSNFPRKIILFIVSLIIVYGMGQALLQGFGILCVIGYISACINGATQIIDKPERSLVWGVGYAIGSSAISILLHNVLPILSQRGFASIIGALVVVYVAIQLYLKAKELKDA